MNPFPCDDDEHSEDLEHNGEDSCDEENEVKEMTKQRQQVADQEAVDGLPAGAESQ